MTQLLRVLWRATPWLLVHIAIAGCASQPLVGHYEAPATPCCSTLADYQFPVLPLARETDFSLTAQSPTLAIEGRPRHFAGFRIEDGKVPAAAVFSSYLTTAYLPNATAVVPELLFYDEQLRPIGSASAVPLQGRDGFWRVGLRSRAAVPREARYVLVVAGAGDAGYGPMLRSDNGTPYYIPAAALGDLSIRLFGATE